MIPFLKGFLSNLTSVQSKQILRILSQMRDRGEIRDAKTFEGKLADLAKLIQKDQLGQRTPGLFFGEGDLLESDAVRTFLESLKLDLEAALGETERLSTSMRSHNRILTENYFDSIEAAVTELEAETEAYEVLESQKFIGYTSVVKRFSFDGSVSVPSADPEDTFVKSLLVDGRGGEVLYPSPPGHGDIGIHLGLRKDGEYSRQFHKIEIYTDSTTPQTSFNTSMAGNTPIKAIDGSLDTTWKHSVLLTDYPDYVRLKLALSFTGARRVSALVIDPAADVTMRLVGISYVDIGGREVELPIGTGYSGGSKLLDRDSWLGDYSSSNADWSLPNAKKIIPVGDVVASRFIVTFQQDTAGDAEFYYYDNDLGSWSTKCAVEEFVTGFGTHIAGASDVPAELGFVGGSEDLRRQARFVEYSFGLKDISTLAREYEPNGLFVPEPFHLATAPSVLSLYTDLDLPYEERSGAEFLLQKENYDSEGRLIDSEVLPMLPFGSGVSNERLFFTEVHGVTAKKDTSVLRFYPDFSETFAIYGNADALTVGTDYEVSIDGGDTFESVVPPVGTVTDPLKCLVRIVGPRAGVFYSATYTPLVSTSSAGGEVWLNQEHSVRLGRNQTYVFDNHRTASTVASCKLGLQIILRANTLNTRVSPYLRGAIILGG